MRMNVRVSLAPNQNMRCALLAVLSRILVHLS